MDAYDLLCGVLYVTLVLFTAIQMKKNWLWQHSESLRCLIIVLITWIFCFADKNFTYTGWDTHDIGFVNFLYFSDCLKNGIIPLWNHYTLAGSNFVNFNYVGLFSPPGLIFTFLSWYINPVYSYEIMIQFAVFMGGVGSYLLFRTYSSDKQIALFGSTAFVVALQPIVGQLGFVFSLGSLPWLIYACDRITNHQNINILVCIFWGTLFSLYISYGYLWMNFVNLTIAVFYSTGVFLNKHIATLSENKKTTITNGIHLLAFFSTILFIYGGLQVPGYLNMHFNYNMFNGDYLSPEPRLRSLARVPSYSYNSIYQALIGAINPYIATNLKSFFSELPKWSLGMGLIPTMMLLILPWKKPLGQQIFWLLLLCTAVMYSSGNNNFVGRIIAHIPILNANRWLFVGLFYVSIFLFFLIMIRMPLLKGPINKKAYVFKTCMVGCIFLFLLSWFHSPIKEFIVLLMGVLLIGLLGVTKNEQVWKSTLTLLIVLNVTSFPHSHSLLLSHEYSQKIADRKKEVTIQKNHRRLGSGSDYMFNDEQWLVDKIPFSHGYNNLSNPLYWYLKNEPFLEKLVSVSQHIRIERSIFRANYPSDNEFANALMKDVLRDTTRPTVQAKQYQPLMLKPDFMWELKKLHIEPNTALMQITTNGAALVVFNNVYAPGWQVYINGKSAKLIRTNRIFQGVFLNKAGNYDVAFKYQPIGTIVFILLPYIILLCCIVTYLYRIFLMGLKANHINKIIL